MYFSEDEMKCKGTGECKMDPQFMEVLDMLREDYGKPLVVSSGYRSPSYNAKVSDTGENGPHTTGKAVDFKVFGADAWNLLHLAYEYGFYGIGVSQKGPMESHFIHLDMLESPDYPRPNVWSY